jgi:hypothetical protein
MPSDNDKPADWQRLELYPFSYFDPLRRKWMKARYVATLADIEARYTQSRIEGPPEIREGPTDPRILGAR